MSLGELNVPLWIIAIVLSLIHRLVRHPQVNGLDLQRCRYLRKDLDCQLVELVDLNRRMFESSPCPHQAATADFTGQWLNWLSVLSDNNSVVLNFVNKFNETLLLVVWLEVVVMHKHQHFELKVLLDLFAFNLCLVDQVHGFRSPFFLNHGVGNHRS